MSRDPSGFDPVSGESKVSSLPPVGIKFSTKRIIQILGIVILIVLLMSSFSQMMKFVFQREQLMGIRLSKLFFVGRESNVPTVVSAYGLLFAACLCGTIGLIEKQIKRPYAKHWLGLFFIFIFLSVDELAQLHEQTGTPLRLALKTSGLLYFAWVIPATVLVLLVGIIYAKFLRTLPPQILKLFLLGVFIYFLGSVGMEMLGGKYVEAYGEQSLKLALMVTVEEAMEMFGVLMFNYAFLKYIKLYTPPFQINFN